MFQLLLHPRLSVCSTGITVTPWDCKLLLRLPVVVEPTSHLECVESPPFLRARTHRKQISPSGCPPPWAMGTIATALPPQACVESGQIPEAAKTGTTSPNLMVGPEEPHPHSSPLPANANAAAKLHEDGPIVAQPPPTFERERRAARADSRKDFNERRGARRLSVGRNGRSLPPPSTCHPPPGPWTPIPWRERLQLGLRVDDGGDGRVSTFQVESIVVVVALSSEEQCREERGESFMRGLGDSLGRLRRVQPPPPRGDRSFRRCRRCPCGRGSCCCFW